MSALVILLLLTVYIWLDKNEPENQRITIVGKEHFDE